jgi:type I restriction enzyme S subunit
VAQLDIDATCNQSMAAIVPSSKLQPRFLFWWLSSNYQNIRNMAGGDLRDGLNLELLGNIQCPLPTADEQTQIAKFLDYETAKIDALIAKQQQLIALLQEKRQAVISHAVTKGLNPAAPLRDSGVEWLGQVPAHWTVSQLKYNTSQMQTGPFGSQLHAEDYIQGGIPLVNPIHIINGRIIPESNCSVDSKTYERLARHKLHTGDIIFARRGELGRCAVVREEQDGWLCGSGSLRATLLDRLSPEYAFMLISSSGVRSELALESRGSTMDNLNTDTLGRVRLPVPPLDEQMAILRHIEEISGQFDKLEKLAVSQSELLHERRTALISAAVTGKIDVRGWQPPPAAAAGATP